MDSGLARLIFLDQKQAYAITNRNLKVIEVGGAIEMLGCGPLGCLGKSLVTIAPELTSCEPVLEDLLAGDLPRVEIDWLNRESPDGETLYFSIIVLPTKDEQNQITGLLYLVDDRTEAGVLKQRLSQSRNELRLAQAQLVQKNLALTTANIELQRLDALKSRFIAVAAHELRTPLSSIMGYVEMLADGDVGPLLDGQQAYLAIIQESARRLLSITNSLLDVTRIEAGRLDLNLETVDLCALARAVAQEHHPQLAARSHRLVLECASDLPAALCDRIRTHQIIGNLLSNAIKYSPPGSQITIAIRQAQTPGFLQLSVADEGIGIGVEEQQHLFARFFRASNAADTGAGGTGLGLYITRSLVELHGGRIWLESETGMGSIFYVTLPIAE